jgi:hypothetical protein
MPEKHKHIFLDRTAVTVVVTCRDCQWATIRFTTVDAWKAGAAHEERAHPEREQARNALAHHLKRHAEVAS